jgi:long-chain acyl-CoA synthetase
MGTSSAHRTAYEALLAAARLNPRKVAIQFERESLTYESLLALIDNAALRLFGMDIRMGDAFAAYSHNRPDLLICYYAAAKLGAVFVPLNPNLTAAEVDYAFRHSGARCLLHDDIVAQTARQAAPQGKAVPIAVLRDPQNDVRAAAFPEIDPQSDFLIIYTSGSTGAPKGIVLSHAAQVNAAAALAEMWAIGQDDVTVVGLPLGYLYGLSTAAAVGLQCGGKVVILRRFHPRDALEALVTSSATIYHGVPTMYSMMLEFCEQRNLRFELSQVRELICAGAPLPGEMRQRFAARFDRALHDYYAMTECTPVFGCHSGDPRPVPARAIGRLAPGAAVRILRPDGNDCNVGEEGEILVRGAATMKRYLDSPGLTAAAMQDGFVRSGDLGYRDNEGYYYISGRLKDVILRGGANISPSEVETVLATHPGVQDAAVVGGEDQIFGEVPIAFIVRRRGSQVSADELEEHAARALSDFKVPRRYVFEIELPLGKTGKVDKTELKRRLARAALV